MRRSIAWVTFGLVGALAVLPGCDAVFGPSPTRKPRPAAEAESSKALFFVLPIPAEADREGWMIYAQRQANNDHVIFRGLGPAAGSGTKLPELVRTAVADGASAVIVHVVDTPGLADALAEAEAKGVPVVLIGKPVEPPAGKRPFTRVGVKPFDEVSYQIVEATLEDAMLAGRPKAGTALVVADREGDSTSAERVEALKSAAEKAGLKPKVVAFEGAADGPSALAAGRAIRDEPDLSIVTCADETAMMIASNVRREAPNGAQVLVGGYVSYKNGLIPSSFANESCVAEYRGEELGRLAVGAALDRIGGEEAGRFYEHECRFKVGVNHGKVVAPTPRSNPGSRSANPTEDAGSPKRPGPPRS